MGRSIEITGESIVSLFYAVTLAIVPVVRYFYVWPIDDLLSVLLVVLLAALILFVLADYWNWKSGSLRTHLDSAAERDLPYDITYDPYGGPGQAAKDTWAKAVERLAGDDDED